ncbi:MAG: hypothetical protein V4631_09680 [Pseudomonadota bacterium]
MSFASFVSLAAAVLLIAVLGAIHRRFTPAAVGLGPNALLSIGALPLLVQTGGLGTSPAAAGQVLALAVVGALSIRLRHTVWGIPARFAPKAEPGNAELAFALDRQQALLRDILAASAREHGMTGALLQRQLTAQEEGIASLHVALASFAHAQEQQNRATLMAALSGVIADFNTRINGQFGEHLVQLAEVVASNVALQDKHRAQQGEMMHHARRSADQMSLATQSFRELVASSSALAAMGTQLAQALELLDPRQGATDAALAAMALDLGTHSDSLARLHARSDADIDEVSLRTRKAIDGLGQRLGQQVNDIGLALQRQSEQTRSQIGDAGCKGQQQAAALNKELGDALDKAAASLTKQLAAVSVKLAGELGPMALQIRRVAEQAKIGK